MSRKRPGMFSGLPVPEPNEMYAVRLESGTAECAACEQGMAGDYESAWDGDVPLGAVCSARCAARLYEAHAARLADEAARKGRRS
jgi:hypothetical protein